MGEVLDDLSAQSTLLLARAEGLEFDDCTKSSWRVSKSLGVRGEERVKSWRMGFRLGFLAICNRNLEITFTRSRR
jgi:hypothetical protein